MSPRQGPEFGHEYEYYRDKPSISPGLQHILFAALGATIVGLGVFIALRPSYPGAPQSCSPSDFHGTTLDSLVLARCGPPYQTNVFPDGTTEWIYDASRQVWFKDGRLLAWKGSKP